VRALTSCDTNDSNERGGLTSPVFRSSNKEAQVRFEVEALRSLGKDELRARWTKLFGKAPPPALTKDLLDRMIAWRKQPRFAFPSHALPSSANGATPVSGPVGNCGLPRAPPIAR
jgi:hypothetical protein